MKLPWLFDIICLIPHPKSNYHLHTRKWNTVLVGNIVMTSHHISRLLCFAPWMIFLCLVIDSDNIRATLCIIYGRFVLFCWFFLLMPICCNCNYIYMMCLMRRRPFQMLYLLRLWVSWSSVSDASNAVYSFLHFRLVFNSSCVVFSKLHVTRQTTT